MTFERQANTALYRNQSQWLLKYHTRSNSARLGVDRSNESKIVSQMDKHTSCICHMKLFHSMGELKKWVIKWEDKYNKQHIIRIYEYNKQQKVSTKSSSKGVQNALNGLSLSTFSKRSREEREH